MDIIPKSNKSLCKYCVRIMIWETTKYLEWTPETVKLTQVQENMSMSRTQYIPPTILIKEKQRGNQQVCSVMKMFNYELTTRTMVGVKEIIMVWVAPGKSSLMAFKTKKGPVVSNAEEISY